MEAEERRIVGWLGLGAGAVLVVANLLHPLVETDTFSSGAAFVAETSDFWIGLHLVIALALPAIPLVAHTWAKRLQDPTARVLGRLAFLLLLMGTAVGFVHSAGVEGVALPSYRDVVVAGGEAPGADLLLDVHLATFVSWVLLLLGLGQLMLGLAELTEPAGRTALAWVLVVGAMLGLASAIGSGLEGRLTATTDALLLRPASAAALAWLFLVSWELRRAAPAASEKAGPAPGGE